ncbi:MAG: hypothetical protein M1833_004173 [Piccolia ochrophora]|nr:MAG: hypothetical protein M1833_004173 [Piccolia ochrophora]
MPFSSYGGGGELTAKKLKDVTLPDKSAWSLASLGKIWMLMLSTGRSRIKCIICNKTRNKNAYSQRQLNDLAYKVVRGGQVNASRALIKCRQCTGAQVTEMMCIVCEEVMALDSFSRNQRRTPETARCLACVKRHVETDPTIEVLDGDSDVDGEEYDSDDLSNFYGSEIGQNDPVEDIADLTVDKLTLGQLSGRGSAQSLTSNEIEKPESSRESMAGKESQKSGSTSDYASTVFKSDKNESFESDENGWVTRPRRGMGVQAATGTSLTRHSVESVGQDYVKAPSSLTVDTVASTSADASRKSSKWAKVKASKVKDWDYTGGIYSSAYGVGDKSKNVSYDDDEDDEIESLKEW